MHPVAGAPDAEGAQALLDVNALAVAARGEGEAADVDMGMGTGAGDAGDDEDDRRTIRGVGTGTGDTGEEDELVEGKKVVADADACEREHGHGQHHDAKAQGRTTSRGREKVVVGGGPVAQSPLVMSS